MNEEETKPTSDELLFAFMMMRYKVFMITSVLDIPILITLYYLDYQIGFTFALILSILSSLGFASWLTKVEKRLKIKV